MIYAFATNEYHWKRISLSKHKSAESAARSLRKRYKYKGTSTTDYCFYELTKPELEKWCLDANYRIDWENMVLISNDAEVVE